MIPINILNELPDLEKEDRIYYGYSLVSSIVDFNIQFEFPIKILNPKQIREILHNEGILLSS